MTQRAEGKRLALSSIDLALIVVMAALVKAHIATALAGSLVALLFVVQHAAIIVLTLAHRRAGAASQEWWDVLLAWAGTLLPLAMRPGGAELLAVGRLLVGLGSVLATTAILSLGRSFGLEPTHRGLRVGGLYRIVRHPIYAAYLLIVGGYLLTSWSWWNMVVALNWLAVQVLRIRQEEQLLSTDPGYRAYVETVPYRLMPGLW